MKPHWPTLGTTVIVVVVLIVLYHFIGRSRAAN